MLTMDGSLDFLNKGMNLTESWGVSESASKAVRGKTYKVRTGNVDSGHVGKVDAEGQLNCALKWTR
jgi:hypothetical protein